MVAPTKSQTLGSKISDREKAIVAVYGKNNEQIKLPSGEIITSWMVEGHDTFESLSDLYDHETAISIYDSGM